MLDEIGELTLTTSWKKVRSQIKDDPRYSKFSQSDRVSENKEAVLIKLLIRHCLP